MCARCAGIYAGAFVAAWLVPVVRGLERPGSPLALGLAALPMAFDVLLENALGTPPNAFVRCATGLLLGAAVVTFVLPALVRAGEEVSPRCATKSSTYRA